jgi:hypothetical protein
MATKTTKTTKTVVAAKVTEGDEAMLALRRVALSHPDVEEGLACKGTVIQSATFKVRGKAFLFLRPGKAMLKLDTSQGAASKLAAKKPGGYTIGAGGWATVDLSHPKEVSMKVLASWIAESYGLFAAKKTPSGGKKK